MPTLWVKAGACGQETVIEARKTSPTKAELFFETSCEHVKALSEELKSVNIGDEMSMPMNETTTYKLATKHLCRNSCIVPAAILKAVEVAAEIFKPENATVEFIDGII